MPHTCENCGEIFETLTRLRLHDCPVDQEATEQKRREREWEEFDAWIRKLEHEEAMAVKRKASDEFVDALERAMDGDHEAVLQVLAQYERHLSEEWENYDEGLYWGFHDVFFGPVVDGLETAVSTEGWPLLLDVLEAYWPENSFEFERYPEHEPFDREETDDYDQFPHISHVLATVAGKQMVRTHRTDGVAAIPAGALDYQLRFHRHPGDESPWIDSMSYGWGIEHPEHPVRENIEMLVRGQYDLWASTAIEHAFHANQHATASLLEDMFEKEIVADPGLLFRPIGTIEHGYYPDTSGHWGWETLYPEFTETGFDWDTDVHERLRTVVEECGFAAQLSDDWAFADLLL